MLKKSFGLLSLSLALISSTLLPQTSFASSGFNQGEEFHQGAYSEKAQLPVNSNWSHNYSYNGSEESNLKWAYLLPYQDPNTGIRGIKQFRGQITIDEDGTIYAGNQDGKLRALNPDGTLKWEYAGNYIGDMGVAIGQDGTIYSSGRGLHALHSDGTLKWKYNTPKGLILPAPIVLNDGTILVVDGNNADKQLIAVNSNGTLKWQSSIKMKGSASYTSSVLVSRENVIYVTTFDTQNTFLYAYDLQGNLLFEKNHRIEHKGLILNTDGNLLITFGSTLAILDKNNGEILKQTTLSGTMRETPTVAKDGTIYVGVEKALIALNQDLSIKWQYPLLGYVGKPIISLDGTIYVPSSYDGYYAITPNGLLKWKYKFSPSYTSISSMDKNGIIYVGGTLTLNGSEYGIFAFGKDKEQPEPIENLWTKPTTMEPLPSGWTDDNRQRVEAGTYKITFKAKSDSGKSLLNLYASSRSTLDINIPTTTEYQEYSYEFTTINNEIFLYGRYGVSDISVKDIVLEKVE